MKNLSPLMAKYFPVHVMQYLQEAGQMAWELENPLYLIGGSIRDMLLEAAFDWDVDLVGEQFIEPLALALSEKWGGQVQCFPEFGTAKIYLDEQLTVDIATARTEVYDSPGVNPQVSFSDLNSDLIRRDFTINAMALDLSPDAFGYLIDPFEGYQDLHAKTLRALHDKKFIEDPVRSWRACRFESSLGFQMAAPTQISLEHAMDSGCFDGFLTERIKKELFRVLRWDNPLPCLQRLESLGVLRCLGISLTAIDGSQFEKIPAYQHFFPEAEPYLVRLLLLIQQLQDTQEREHVLHTFAFPSLTKAWSQLHALREHHLSSDAPVKTYHALKKTDHHALWALLILETDPSRNKALLHFLVHLRHVQLSISGNIIRQWVPPGPQIGQILNQILEAKLRGEVPTEKDELSLAQTLAQCWQEETESQHA